VGFATSGPHTGGSQWFIALSPQPHLDQNYTVFASVTAGLDVVRRLQRGDKILAIEIEP
jgi:cyclophilin family peptidyl-prolyl cis-trans isomerase